MASSPTSGALSPERAAALLGISPTATPTEIRAAYNAKARVAHPDRFAGGTSKQQADASARFIRLTEAYEVLRLGGGYARSRGASGPASDPASAGRQPRFDDNPAPRTSGTSHRAAASGTDSSSGGRESAADGIWMTRPDHAVREASRRQRAIVRGVVIGIAALLALLFSSNAVGLSPGSFRIAPSSHWYLPVMLVAETVCLLAVASGAIYAATGNRRLGIAAVISAGVVVLAFIVSALITSPFTFSTIVFTSFAAFVTASPFLALVLIGRSRQEAREHEARIARSGSASTGADNGTGNGTSTGNGPAGS